MSKQGDQEPQPESINIALHSGNADYDSSRDEWVFTMPDFNPRIVRASLGTLELPPVQHTVERQWCELEFDEGLSLIADNDRRLSLHGADRDQITLPMSRNPIVSVQRRGATSISIETQFDHALVTADGVSVAACYDTGIGVVLTPSGLSLSASTATLSYVDARKFVVTWPESEAVMAATLQQRGCDNGPSVQAAALSSARQVARVLNAAATGSDFRAWPSEDGASLLWRCDNATVTEQGGLGDALGMRQRVRSGSAACSATNAFGARVKLPTGQYDMRRLMSTWQRCFAPITPPPVSQESGVARLFLTDGVRLVGVPLISTTYTLGQIEAIANTVIRDASQRAEGIGGATSRLPQLRFFMRDEHLVVRSADDVTTFGITFEPPESVPAELFGFDDVSYDGRAEYVSPHKVSMPMLHYGTAERAPRLHHSVRVATTHIEAVAVQPRLVVQDGIVQRGEMCDLHPGDLCFLAGFGFVHVNHSEIVMAPARRGDGSAPGPPIPSMRISFDEVQQPSGVVTVAPDACVSLHVGTGDNAIRPDMIGFAKRTHSAPPDGTASAITGPVTVPPLQGCHVPMLDHVPYVLLQIGNGVSHPSTMQRAVLPDGNTIVPFAKICFVPYRVERTNPAEVYYRNGESIGPMRLRILNPDGTPYRTHGTPFTLSINILTMEP